MLNQLRTTHSNTPSLTVSDSRGKVARSICYYRAGRADDAGVRVDRTVHDAVGRASALWDARLFVLESGPSNLSNVYALSGAILASNSVDAGLHISLFGEAGQSVQGWDGRGSQRWMRYDEQLRLSELFEQAAGGDSVCAERLAYASNDQAFADHNQCGRLIRHEDPAGVLLCNDYGLNGAALEQERRFTSQKTTGFVTHSQFCPPGELISVTDAQGNEQRFHQTVGGSLRAVDLRLNGTLEWLPIVRTITYNAHGQVEQEVAGNGVITTLEYGPEDGRLKRLLSRLDTNAPLQDLHYTYDPVGNVLSIEDAALPIRYFANQRIEPISHFLYDTLYRLVEATGWEAGAVKHGPSASRAADPAMPLNYRQTYRYDAGNNLLELTHVGAQDPGHRLVAEMHSNRCLPVLNGVEPTENDFRNGFDANGNLLQLQPGQTLSWDVRNQLREVRPVVRTGADDDIETYEYGADGMRVCKVRSLQTGIQTNTIETRYLPGLQIRTHSGTGEELHVIEVSTGRGSVRVLHWKAGKPPGISNNQQRYTLTDHLGSSTLELDEHANIIIQEHYYPFGGTAWSNGEAVQVSYKIVRYSGKERDATGLYYYGLRYYIERWQRWLNPDPAGYAAGSNLFGFVRGNPMKYRDLHGQVEIDVNALTPEQSGAVGLDAVQVSAADKLFDSAGGARPFGRLMQVDDKTMRSLKAAHVANLVTKMLLVDGAANQAVDIWRARQEPLEVARKLRESRGRWFNRVQGAIDGGVGNCHEHSRINFNLLASVKTEYPVFRVSAAKDVDHEFVVIGDHRELPLEKIVIADAWPTFPGAHTAEVGRYEIGDTLESATAGSHRWYAIDDAKLIEHSQIVFEENWSQARLKDIWRMDAHTVYFSTNEDSLGIDYHGESFPSGRFNQLPITYVLDRVVQIKALNSMVQITNKP